LVAALRSEGQAYAARLQDAGVPATLSNYETSLHGFLSMGKLSDHTQGRRRHLA